MLIELSYICTQFMKYQNLRGGRVKLHHIMVRYLLFFSAKKETTTTKLSKTSPLKKVPVIYPRQFYCANASRAEQILETNNFNQT